MPFDPFRSIANLEKKSPKLARFIAINFLSWLSPFNAHLGSKLIEWTDNKCVIRVRRHRGVTNHVKAVHAGAQFTLGETCAGLVIIRNFPFAKYRPLMSDVQVNYAKQARGDVTGECVLSPETVERMKREIAGEEKISYVELETVIRNIDGETASTVRTKWQVKSWDAVRTPIKS